MGIYVGHHFWKNILPKQWADLALLVPECLYKWNFKFEISHYPEKYFAYEDDYKQILANVDALRQPYSKVSCMLPMLDFDGEYLTSILKAHKVVDYLLKIFKRVPSWFVMNEPYNVEDKHGNKCNMVNVVKALACYEAALMQMGIDRKIYTGDGPDEWKETGWYELRNSKGVVYPKAVHYGHLLDEGLANIRGGINFGRISRSTEDVICDECSVYNMMPGNNDLYEDTAFWNNPAHNLLRASVALMSSHFKEFCWWPLYFHRNEKYKHSVGIMSNTLDGKQPALHPVLKYFIKPKNG